MLVMDTSGMPFGQAVAHSPVSVQPPKPSSSICATMSRTRVSRSGDDLVPGDVITLEPGLYRAGYGGVRLEDILIVTDGGAEVVTDYPYELEP